jgi:hypothetical protein
MRRQDKYKVILEANQKLEEKYLKDKGLLKENALGELISIRTNAKLKNIGDRDKSVEMEKKMQELQRKISNSGIYREMRELKEGIVNADIEYPINEIMKSKFQNGLKDKLKDIMNYDKELGVSELDIKESILRELYTEFFDRGSGSFVRSYAEKKTIPTLEFTKEVLDELGIKDTKNKWDNDEVVSWGSPGLGNKIESWVKATKPK